MKPTGEIIPGAVFEVRHPFIRSTYSGFEMDGPFEIKCWRPGTRTEPCAPDDFDVVADGDGTQVLTVVSVHKPGRFPTRVFYTRLWRGPDGKEFGNSSLRVKTAQQFRQLATGYRHDYRLAEQAKEIAA